MIFVYYAVFMNIYEFPKYNNVYAILVVLWVIVFLTISIYNFVVFLLRKLLCYFYTLLCNIIDK